MRTHERVLAEGTFRLVLTDKHRIVVALDAETALGPVHLVTHIDHGLVLPRAGSRPMHHDVGGFFDDIGHAVSNVADSAFKVLKTVAPVVAGPALGIVQAAAQGASALVNNIPLPPEIKKPFQAATRIVSRAGLGDIEAQKFIGGVLKGVRDNVPGARKIADTLLAAHHFVSNAIKNVEDVQNPQKKIERLLAAVKKGDWNAVKNMAHQELSNFQGVASMVPGLGTAASAGISAGLAALEGGNPIEIAIRTAYGAIPIPIGVRHGTDASLDAVVALLHGGNLTDAAIAAARDAVPSGIGRDVFDALSKVLVKGVPVQKVAEEKLGDYLQRYGGQALHAIPLPADVTSTPRLLLPAGDVARMLRPLHLAAPS